MQLLPAIDLRGGRVVRLLKGDDAHRTVYGDDPLAVLEAYRDAGVRRAHVVDLDAALGEPPQRRLIARLARLPDIGIQLGGGLRGGEAIAWALEAGCERAVVGSLVARDPELFARLATACPGRLVPALDVARGELRVAGWREGSAVPLAEVCRNLSRLPCPQVLVTDIERDGTLQGPNFELTQQVGRACGMPALLSGGVHSLDDLRQASQRREIGGAIVGKALYEGRFTVAEALAACRGEAEAATSERSVP
jgi:phosphoribosylformimino-5-aminoimidazole carboxamide ribotide isomerase